LIDLKLNSFRYIFLGSGIVMIFDFDLPI
jgi:hypothetical protein